MRLPLLIEGNVAKMVNPAIIRLPAGKWKVVVENLLNSILIPTPGSIIDGGKTLSVNFSVKGTETNLNIYLEKCQ